MFCIHCGANLPDNCLLYTSVLGPVRMDYPRVAALLGYVTSQVSQAFAVLMRDE